MPTYEYLCDSCGHNYEIVQKISEDSLKTCPSCGKEALKRVINATAFHLKGSGWYKTDYASSTSGSSSSSSSSSSSTSGGTSASTPATENKPKAESSSSATTTSTSGTTATSK